MTTKRERRIFLRIVPVLWLALLLFLIFSQLPDKNLHLVFCDVGQGDAILISQGEAQVLIDGGSPVESGKLLNCLSSKISFWDRKIELLVNSHPEEDHFGSLPEILKRYRVNTFLNNGFDNPQSWRFAEFQKELIDKKICSKKATALESFRIKDIYFDILWPGTTDQNSQNREQVHFYDQKPNCQKPNFESSDQSLNQNSIVLHLRFGQFDLLLPGDLPSEVEQILAWRKKLPQVEILKITHHGSKESTSEELLVATRPKLAIISVGENHFGHPTEEVLKRLSDYGINYLRTDQEGTIELVTDGKSWYRKN